MTEQPHRKQDFGYDHADGRGGDQGIREDMMLRHRPAEQVQSTPWATLGHFESPHLAEESHQQHQPDGGPTPGREPGPRELHVAAPLIRLYASTIEPRPAKRTVTTPIRTQVPRDGARA